MRIRIYDIKWKAPEEVEETLPPELTVELSEVGDRGLDDWLGTEYGHPVETYKVQEFLEPRSLDGLAPGALVMRMLLAFDDHAAGLRGATPDGFKYALCAFGEAERLMFASIAVQGIPSCEFVMVQDSEISGRTLYYHLDGNTYLKVRKL